MINGEGFKSGAYYIAHIASSVSDQKDNIVVIFNFLSIFLYLAIMNLLGYLDSKIWCMLQMCQFLMRQLLLFGSRDDSVSPVLILASTNYGDMSIFFLSSNRKTISQCFHLGCFFNFPALEFPSNLTSKYYWM